MPPPEPTQPSPRPPPVSRPEPGTARGSLTTGQYKAHRAADPSTVAAEHAAILEAIRSGDAAAAAERLAYHLEQAQGRLLGTLPWD
jgi:DNA-binding GntR family transcriptional regulator